MFRNTHSCSQTVADTRTFRLRLRLLDRCSVDTERTLWCLVLGDRIIDRLNPLILLGVRRSLNQERPSLVRVDDKAMLLFLRLGS